MKDTFRTLAYKGHYIQLHHERDIGAEVVRVQFVRKDGGFHIRTVKSLHAAKLAITKHLRIRGEVK